MERFKNHIGLGIAGNFALHLEQAGESADFANVITEDPNGPKGIFPFYIPGKDGYLGIYPLSHDTICLPREECNVQMEPEVGLVCDLIYNESGSIASIIPKQFGAYNDCSLRKEGVPKISLKKNWGTNTKGVSSTLIDIDRFEDGGVMDHFRIASFLRRDGMTMRYGEDVELQGYSYFYKKLLDWLILQVNTQKDFGPLEEVCWYIKDAGNPTKMLISIGATRYTHFGETTFLQEGDEIVVVVYDNNLYCLNPMMMMVNRGELDVPGVSALVQKVVRA